MTVQQACWSVAGDVEVVRAARPEDSTSTTRVVVEATEPVFQGHYPGFPIFPGVCLIECAHRSALATLPGDTQSGVRPTLDAVVSARLLNPVYPGDVVTIDLSWQRTAAGWQVRTVARTAHGESARIRLRYRLGETA